MAPKLPKFIFQTKAALGLLLFLFCTACSSHDGEVVEEGPGQRAGRSIDEAAQTVSDKAVEVANKVAEGATRAWDSTKEGVREGTQRAAEATERGAANLKESLEPAPTPTPSYDTY